MLPTWAVTLLYNNERRDIVFAIANTTQKKQHLKTWKTLFDADHFSLVSELITMAANGVFYDTLIHTALYYRQRQMYHCSDTLQVILGEINNGCTWVLLWNLNTPNCGLISVWIVLFKFVVANRIHLTSCNVEDISTFPCGGWNSSTSSNS